MKKFWFILMDGTRRCQKNRRTRKKLSSYYFLFISAGVLFFDTGLSAQTSDTLTISAGHRVETDSNLYRLSAASIAQGGPFAGTERIKRSSVGISLNKEYSLQRFSINADLLDSKFQNAKYLDFVARNADAAWQWKFTPRLHGSLRSFHRESLSGFVDNPAFNVRNVFVEQATNFDITYEIGAAWHLLGGVASTSQSSVQPLAAVGSTSLRDADIGVRYQSAAGGTLTYLFKSGKGSYKNRSLQPILLLDDGFAQRENSIQLTWPIAGKTVLGFNIAHVARTHPHFGERNYHGFVMSSDVSWAITGKTALTAKVARDISSYQDNNSNYAQSDSLRLAPIWKITSKTSLGARYELIQTQYLGAPAGAAANPRRDITRSAGISLEWEPFQSFAFSATLQSARRSSNQANLDYSSNMASIGAQYRF